MSSGPGTDTFRPLWLVTALRALLAGRTSPTPRRVAVTIGDTTLTLTASSQGTTVSMTGHHPADATITADPATLLGLAAGVLTVDQALTAADSFDGDPGAVAALFALPRPGAAQGGHC